MPTVNFFSPSLSIVSVEKLISVDLTNEEQRSRFSGLQQAQDFFCDFLPVATEFIYEFNSIRNYLSELSLSDDPEERSEGTSACDDRLAIAHEKGVKFVVRWAADYFNKKLDYSDPRDDVTATLRYFNVDGQTPEGTDNYLATAIASFGPRKVEKEIRAEDDSSLADYVFSSSSEASKVVGVFQCNDLIEWSINKDFFHPELGEGKHSSRQLLSDAYNSFWHTVFFRKPEKRLTPYVMKQWNACWTNDNAVMSSIATFPITLSNNVLTDDLKLAFTRIDEDFDQHEVFGALCLDSKRPYAFNAGDMLMGKIWSDALFTFAGASTHYTEISRLRAKFDV